MQILDMRDVEPGTVFDTDLAIVGTGPAGLSIAREFFGSNVRVTLLEAGGLTQPVDITPSEEFESSGSSRHTDPRRVRNRIFGGSSHSWSGKCRTFDNIDFERRDWVPYSGWPITRAEVLSYADRAATLMHLGPNTYDKALWNLLGGRNPNSHMSSNLLESCFWQFARDPDQSMDFLRFGPHFLKQTAPNVQVFVHAAVTHIDTDESGQRLTGLEVSPAAHRKIRIVPKVAVLAAGGIDNARLLLASNRVRPNGVGNDCDVVGRFLMDHPRAAIAEYSADTARSIQLKVGLFQLRQEGRTFFYSHGLALSPALQRQSELLNCAAYLSEHRADDDPWEAIKRIYGGQVQSYLKDALSVVSHPLLLLEGVYERAVGGRNVRHKIDKLVVDCLVEQTPDPNSRLTLSQRRDEQGVPLAHLHWKISELERRTVAEMAHIFASEVGRLGMQQPTVPAWLANRKLDEIDFTDMAHPTGTTRMSDDPKLGVVNRDSRVHDMPGLYIAGSSVFPTASHANPTLMIVAMALRLANTLKNRHFA